MDEKMEEKMKEKFREEYKSCSTKAFNYYVEGYENDSKKCLALAEKYKDRAYMYGKQLGLTKEEIDQDCIYQQ